MVMHGGKGVSGMKITMGDVDSIYGCFGKNYDYAVRLITKMKDSVDGELLEQALRITEKRYPYLSLRMRKTEEEYYFEENPAPVVLFHSEKRLHLNMQETNYHIWAVSYQDDRIIVDVYHGLLDGLGMYKLLATLLYYYCNLRYEVTDHTGVRTLEDEIRPCEWEDPQDMLPPPVPSGDDEPVEAFSLTRDGGLPDNDPVQYDILLPENDFVKLSSSLGGSPGTVVALLMEHALDRWFPERKKPIVCTYIINGRPMLHARETYHNCLSGAHFVYSDEMKALPFDMQNTILRGITMYCADEEKVRNDLAGKVAFCKELLKNSHTVEDRNNAFKEIVDSDARAQTCMVSYLGRWTLPATKGYMQELWGHVPAVNDLYIGMVAVDGKICLTLQQVFDDDTFLKFFCEELREHGISYEVRPKAKIDTAFYPRPE